MPSWITGISLPTLAVGGSSLLRPPPKCPDSRADCHRPGRGGWNRARAGRSDRNPRDVQAGCVRADLEDEREKRSDHRTERGGKRERKSTHVPEESPAPGGRGYRHLLMGPD